MRNSVAHVLAALSAVTISAPAFASSLGKITVSPSFETAGVIVQVDGDQGNATVLVEVRGPGKQAFEKAHPTVRFEPGAFGTSLFSLAADEGYDLRVTLTDPDGVTGNAQASATLHTRAEPKDPKSTRVRWVGPSGQDSASAGAAKGTPYATISYALAQAMPGDQIRVLDGTYGAVSAAGVHGTAAAPIVVIADDASKKPIVDGNMSGTAFELDDAAYVVVDGLEIRNGGDDGGGNGFYLRGSAHCTLRHSFVHDNGHNDVLIAKADQYSGGLLEGGFHLIEDNEIADTDYDPCSEASNTACPRQTYYGVKQDNNPGGGTVVRRNHIHGHDDNMSPCGDEDSARDLQDGQPVLALVGNGGAWSNHDLEIYDNTIEDARDDGMELDGILRQRQDWHNTIKNAQNAFSAAPVMPGPYFFVRNVATGNWGPSDSGFKTNTNGNADVPSRHVFVYHNTFVRSNKGAVLNLWFAQPGQHDVPLHDFVYKNNVFMAAAGGPCTTAYNEGMEQPSFDGNVWFTTDTAKIFQWWDGSQVVSYDSFADYQSGTHQDANGAFGDPGLNDDFTPKKGALVVDRGLPIDGINDDFAGKAPDVGAFELGEKPPPMGAGGAGGSGGAGAGAGEGSGGKSASGGGGAGGDDKDAGGCGCVVAGAPRQSNDALVLLAWAGLAVVASRRARRRA